MKTKNIGIACGMSSASTADFFHKLVSIEPDVNLLIDNSIVSADRMKSDRQENLVPSIIESIHHLASIGADFVVLPSNSAHHYYDEIAPHIKIPWLNMISVITQVITEKKKAQPLILGGYLTITQQTYSHYLPQAQYLSKEQNEMIYDAIAEIRRTNNLPIQQKQAIIDALDMKKDEADCIILASTELPAILTEKRINGLETIDTSMEYAKATVAFAQGDQQLTVEKPIKKCITS